MARMKSSGAIVDPQVVDLEAGAFQQHEYQILAPSSPPITAELTHVMTA